MNLKVTDVLFLQDEYIKSLEFVDDGENSGYRDPKYPNVILKLK